MKKKSIRFISALLLLSMCMGLFSGCVSENVSQDSTPGNTESDAGTVPEGNTVLKEFTDRNIQNEEDALAAIQEVSTVTGITNVSDTLGGAQQFSSLDSTFYRFAQIYEGIPVFGRSVTVGVSSEGAGQGLSHNYIQIKDMDTTPTVSENTAKQTVVDMYGTYAQVTSCNLTIYSLFGYTPTLAWQIQVAGPAMLYTCFVDAHTGAFITSFSGIFTESEVGTYTDSKGTIDFYTVKNADGTYSLIDEDRNLEVYDANYQTVIRTIVDDHGNIYQYDSSADKWLDGSGSEVVISGMEDEKSFWLMYGSWEVLDAQGNVVGRNADYFPCAGNPLSRLHILTNPSTAWSNQKAAAAMSLTEDIYDFYQSVLGRSGFNGNNGTVRISINDDIDVANGGPSNAYSAMGGTRAFTFLSFGHAKTITADLIGHEFNHSVEQSISSLIYQGESGAIMEALADVFGELSEDWIGDQQLDDDCDWIHGSRNMIDPAASTQQDCYYEYNGQTCPVKAKDKEGKHRIGNGLKDPSWFSTGSCVLDIPYPKYYQGENYYFGSGDNGGVHTNHTVISHAAYLMTHPNNPAVDALTNEELAKVLYYALSYLPSDCSFEAFASYVCLSAEVLKISESKQDCIVQAFKSVGVEASNVLLVSVSEYPLDYMVTETSEWNVLGKSGALCDDYTLRVSGKETLKNLYHTGPFEEADQTTTEYKVTTKEPLTLTLDPGYMYDFEFVDGTDPEITFTCKVGVHEDSLGLIDVIDLHTQFGPALAVRENGLIFLTERPSTDRPGLFTFKEYDLEGYAYETDRGGYTIETICPRTLNVVANFVGDFTHSGKRTDFTVQKDRDDYFNGEKLCLQIEGVINAYVNDLSLYNDKEVYYYIVDGTDTAYLVCEMVEYDNFSVSKGKYHYKTGSDSGKDVTESIIIINMSNYTKHMFTVEYNTEHLHSSYEEKIEEFMGASTTNNLFYTGYSNEGQFSNYDDVVAYIKNALSPYGLADRVLSDSSSLSNYTPVYTTTVIGEPKSGSVDDYEDARIRGKGIVGFPTYTGTWFPDGIVKDPVTPSEDDSADSNPSAKYEAFLSNRVYLSDWTNLDISSYYTLGSYSLIDIDQNGTDELIIVSNSDIGFLAFLVYTIDAASGEIVRLPIDRSEVENNIISCYGDPRYSPKYKALVFSETRPTAMCGGVEYFVVAGDCLYSIGTVGADSFITEGKMTYYSTLSGTFEEISEDARDDYISELASLEYHPLP